MDAKFIEQMITEVFTKVDIRIVIALMAIGFVIKHFKFLEKFQNEFIPPFLFLLSFVFSFFANGFTLDSVFVAIITGALAIGLHQGGKNIFTVSIIPYIVQAFKPHLSEAETSEDKDEVNDKEQV